MLQNIKTYLVSFRLYHWIKNLFIFIPIIFSNSLFNSQIIINAIIAFFSFSLASSAVYLFNDVMDIEYDQKHPLKNNRPIASGKMKVKEAIISAVILLIASLMLSIIKLNQVITIIIIIYIAINILYSTILKYIPIIDAFTVALGFMLRMFVGATLTTEEPSYWIILMTFFLALFISFGKQRAELIIIKSQNESNKRIAIKSYTPNLIDQINASLVSIIILYYTFYTINYTDERLGIFIPYTVPIVTFGCLRYLYLIQKNYAGNPVKLLFKDMWILSTVIIWLFIIIIILYY